MKKYYLFFLFLLFLPNTLADISLQSNQQVYNLGNKLVVSASIIDDKNFEGLFKLTISCEDYKLEYFLTPISLEANFRTAINIPELTVTPAMVGNCAIKGDLTTNDNLIIEEKESNKFEVTDQLKILPVNSKIITLPGETIQLAGIVNEAHGNNVLKATITIKLDNNSYSIDAIDGKFEITIKLPKTIKSRQHTIEISAFDSKNNIGANIVELQVTAIPTYIKTDLSKSNVVPGSRIDIISSLYDQADDLINVSLDLELVAPNGNKVFTKSVQSNEFINYEFSQYIEPGIYVLSSYYMDLLTRSLINVTAVREIKVKYGNESVFVENIGNIPFEDELTFILQNKLKKYPITKKIKIEPGKLLSIDLSKEVPQGIYDVLVPLREGFSPIQSINNTLSNLFNSNINLLAGNVTIHDNRPVYRKLGSGLASISSSLVGADGILAKNPIIAPLILVAILLLIIFRYGRKPLMRLIKRKKDDEK